MDQGKDKAELNWIFANQYSLLNFLKKQGINCTNSISKLKFNANAFVDQGELKKSDRVSRLATTDTIVVPPITTGVTKYEFIDGEKTPVSLLYLKSVAFNPYMKEADIADVEEEKSKKSTTASIGKTSGIVEVLGNVRDAINKRVKYFPIVRLYLDKKECPWFVPEEECEYRMADIAMKKYLEFEDLKFQELSPIGKSRKLKI